MEIVEGNKKPPPMLLSRGWVMFLELLNLQKVLRFIIIRKTKKDKKLWRMKKKPLL